MSHRARTRAAVAASGVTLLALTACGVESAPTTAVAPSGSSLDCSLANLPLRTPGTLTIATDSPAYPPYFEDDDPTNGKGFESAVAYAVAQNLGFTKEQVKWVVVPFNSSYAPGNKSFDFDINQIGISPERAQAVDFSDGYYAVQQVVIALKDSPAAAATSVAELKAFKLGAQVGTTGLKYIQDVVAPTSSPSVYDDTNAAIAALNNNNIDAIVVDLPTGFYIRDVQAPGSTIVGAFPVVQGGDQLGLLFEKGSALVPCVNNALALLESQGTLAQITEQYLGGEAGVPTLS